MQEPAKRSVAYVLKAMAMTASMMFQMNPLLDIDRLAQDFAIGGRVSIDDFLMVDMAEALREYLITRDDWVFALNAGGKVYEMPLNAHVAMDNEAKAALHTRIAAAAIEGFQFRYSRIAVPDQAGSSPPADDLLAAFARFMRSPEVLMRLQTIVGKADVNFIDAQATRYDPGDFLTVHDDDVEGKGRHAAYVLGLTPNWRTEWGGLLMFHDAQGKGEFFSPVFNSLRIFSVPSLHSVSPVWPYAPEYRMSLTGWLRTCPL